MSVVRAGIREAYATLYLCGEEWGLEISLERRPGREGGRGVRAGAQLAMLSRALSRGLTATRRVERGQVGCFEDT